MLSVLPQSQCNLYCCVCTLILSAVCTEAVGSAVCTAYCLSTASVFVLSVLHQSWCCQYFLSLSAVCAASVLVLSVYFPYFLKISCKRRAS